MQRQVIVTLPVVILVVVRALYRLKIFCNALVGMFNSLIVSHYMV